MLSIEFQLFRVLPVILYFISFAYALVFWHIGWVFMIIGLAINGAIWGMVTPITQKHLPHLSDRPNREQCYFFHQTTTTMASGMPSGHCQAAAYFSVWLVIMAIVYKLPVPAIITAACIGILLTVGMTISRVHVYRCHTLPQALVGNTIGITVALVLWPLLLRLKR